MKSILQNQRTCFLHNEKCRGRLDEHHIFNGPKRKFSEEDGLKVYLCRYHHDKVHTTQKYMRALKQEGQKKYLETHSLDEFMERYNKNYL